LITALKPRRNTERNRRIEQGRAGPSSMKQMWRQRLQESTLEKMKRTITTAAPMELESPLGYALTHMSKADRALAEQILARINSMSADLLEVGKMLCKMSDEGREELLAAVPAATQDVFRRLQAVGEGHLTPQAVFLRGRVATLMARLPVAEQEKVMNERVQLLLRGPDGKTDTIMADPATMSAAQIKQVFRAAGSHVGLRTPAEQAAWLDECDRRERSKSTRPSAQVYIQRPDYVVEGGKVYPKPHLCEDGISARMLRKMTADLRG
jgi:hypothetical protein